STATQIDSLQTGLAMMNTSANVANVQIELLGMDGISTGRTGTVSIPANGQVSLFLNQIPGLEAMPVPFQGLVRTVSITPIAVLGLRSRNNGRGDFLVATMFPVSENASASTR